MLSLNNCGNSGRERGIRTPGGMTLNGFQDRRYRPLSHLPKQFKIKMEATPRFELGNQGFAGPCLTAWLCRHTFSSMGGARDRT